MVWLPLISTSLLILFYGWPLIARAGKAIGRLAVNTSKLVVGKVKIPFNLSWVVERVLYTVAVVSLTLWFAGYQPGPGPGPGPGPRPNPTPPVPVVVDGPRTIVIIRESGTDDPLFNRMSVSLRFGENADLLEQGGHKLLILDQNEVNEDGQLLPILANLIPLNPTLPALFILDDKATVLHHETLTEFSAEHVLEVLEDNGG